jgi:hypothetical protein
LWLDLGFRETESLRPLFLSPVSRSSFSGIPLLLLYCSMSLTWLFLVNESKTSSSRMTDHLLYPPQFVAHRVGSSATRIRIARFSSQEMGGRHPSPALTLVYKETLSLTIIPNEPGTRSVWLSIGARLIAAGTNMSNAIAHWLT